jgi:pyroglutamyl-peptidase
VSDRARVILQGFGPDWEIPENPSQMVVEALAEEPPPGVEIIPVIWPNSRAVVAEAVPHLLAEHRPQLWLGTGGARGRPALSVERVGINLLNFPYPDADGQTVRSTPIMPGGRDACLSNLDIDAILSAWREAGIPGYPSNNAGGFMCNMSLYTALATSADLGLDTRCGFIHVPMLPSQVEHPEREPSMDLALQVRGVALAIAVSLPTAR